MPTARTRSTVRSSPDRSGGSAPAAASRRAPSPRGSGGARRGADGRIHLDLALQGGGSHGAFTWGVLDRLLREPDLVFDGVSGTSAGALNAGVLATGLARGGAEAAREALEAFWRDVGDADRCFGWVAQGRRWWDDWTDIPAWGGAWAASSPWRHWWTDGPWRLKGWLTQVASPYQFNPLGINPLREVAERHVDEGALQSGPLKVFVTATSVQTGQAEVFEGRRLGVDALLASACLPHLFQAVEIDGVPYWDGGYTGNPALWPLIYGSTAHDVLLVKINPLRRLETPTTPMAIADRVGEITFNAGLTGELRAIHFVQRLLEEQRIDAARYKSLRLHMIHDEERLAELGPQTKLDTDWAFLQSLKVLGETCAETWLARHRDDLGQRATLDIEGTFLQRRQPAAGKRRAKADDAAGPASDEAPGLPVPAERNGR